MTHSKGVMVYTQGEIYPAFFTGEIKIEGRNGRGDTIVGDYDGQRILGKSPEDACHHAAKICSLKMTSRGPYKGNIK